MNVLIVVTGSIACYKSIDIIKGLLREGNNVTAIVTKSAEKFVTIAAIKQACNVEVYNDDIGVDMEHIKLAKWANLIAVCPCTAHKIAELDAMLCNTLSLAVIMASEAEVLIFPAMNPTMWTNINPKKYTLSKKRRFTIYEPANKKAACGDDGIGPLLDIDSIVKIITYYAKYKKAYQLMGKKIVITAGATREYLDPVRFITNSASGRQGYILADICHVLGMEVHLISANARQECLPGIHVHKVKTTQEMHDVAHSLLPYNIFVGTAAVTDLKCKSKSQIKIKKTTNMSMEFDQNVDVLKSISTLVLNRPYITIGFALETNNAIEYAKKKIISKRLDAIILNQLDKDNNPFSSHNSITVIRPNSSGEFIINTCQQMLTKEEISRTIIDEIQGIYNKERQHKIAIYTGYGSDQFVVAKTIKFLSKIGYVDTMPTINDKIHNYDLFVMPGGNAREQQASYGAEGRMHILEFIENKGKYLGICAGMFNTTKEYVASRIEEWPNSLNILPAMASPRRDIAGVIVSDSGKEYTYSKGPFEIENEDKLESEGWEILDTWHKHPIILKRDNIMVSSMHLETHDEHIGYIRYLMS